MLAQLSTKIQAKPQTSKARVNPIISNRHADETMSVWSKVVG